VRDATDTKMAAGWEYDEYWHRGILEW
jgi:hypothetical protein